MSEKPVSRRDVLFFLSALGGSVACLIDHDRAPAVKPDPLRGFLGQFSFRSRDPLEIARAFDAASTAQLLVIYTKFFSDFVNARNALDVATTLAFAAQQVSDAKNPHRLDALPAAMACHALRYIPERLQQPSWQVIKKALQAPNREVREIVIQNMISAALPSRDSDRWIPPPEILRSLAGVLDDAEHTPQLLSPASMALTVLLNTRAIVASGSSAKRHTTVRSLNQMITARLNRRPQPLAYHYLARLRDAHEKDFPLYDPHKVTSLPSQHSEMLIQSIGSRGASENYNLELAILQARNTYEVWRTTNGFPDSVNDVMTQGQAARAYPKLLEMQKIARADMLASRVDALGLPASDRSFRDFVANRFTADIRDLEISTNSRELLELGELPVALAEAQWQSVVDATGAQNVDAIGRLRQGVSGTLAPALLTAALYYLRRIRRTRGPARHEALDNLPEDVRAAAVEQGIQEATEIDQEAGEAMDKRESDIGPARILSSESRPHSYDE